GTGASATGRGEGTAAAAGAATGQPGSVQPPQPPVLAAPKGGGAIRGLGEKFSANPATGTGSFSVPLPLSAGRSGFGPALALSYDSGSGNGVFGLGWRLDVPTVTRKSDKGVPAYRDAGPEVEIAATPGAEPVLGAVEDAFMLS